MCKLKEYEVHNNCKCLHQIITAHRIDAVPYRSNAKTCASKHVITIHNYFCVGYIVHYTYETIGGATPKFLGGPICSS